jgi:hypothetical protein
MTLYAYGFTFHYGDGLSNYSGKFLLDICRLSVQYANQG